MKNILICILSLFSVTTFVTESQATAEAENSAPTLQKLTENLKAAIIKRGKEAAAKNKASKSNREKTDQLQALGKDDNNFLANLQKVKDLNAEDENEKSYIGIFIIK